MIIKILALADILAILSILSASILPQKIILIMAVYLILKGIAFVLMGGALTSFLDMVSGFYLIFVAFGFSYWIFTILVIIFLGQKAFFSLV